jgi:hypothetical protein
MITGARAVGRRYWEIKMSSGEFTGGSEGRAD